MNFFDKEERIIFFLQDVSKKEIQFYPKNLKHSRKIKSIINKKRWKNWINSSGKSELPPDFYNTKEKIMMDVMRIDDHAFIDKKGKIVNFHNQRESKLRKELISMNPALRDVSNQGRLIINPIVSDIPIDIDHNYKFYIDNARRVVKKHIDKVEKYKKNHPGYQLVFLVFDESSPYVEKINENDILGEPGQIIKAYPHLWWADRNIMNVLKGSNVDYVIWFTPFKHFNSLEKVELPKVIILDVKEYPYDDLKKYNLKKMESLEK